MTKRKIAVLGGGMAGLAAAFELSNDPQDRFEITVYQMGWRLGGKCASTRNSGEHQRIEEHGLHVLAGFYHNTFRMLRDCYDEWVTSGLGQTRFEDAFTGTGKVTFTEIVDKEYHNWHLDIPDNDNEEPGRGYTPIDFWAVIRFLLNWIRSRFEVAMSLPIAGQSVRSWFEFEISGEVGKAFEEKTGERPKTPERLDDLAALAQLTENILEENRWKQEPNHFLQSFLAETLRVLGEEVSIRKSMQIWPGGNPGEQQGWSALLELSLRIASGAVRDAIWWFGFDSIESYDFRDWLKKHGTSKRAINSGIIRGGYEYVFASDLSGTGPGFGAGTALRGLLRLVFTYHGSFFQKMNGGMGEIVFIPLYDVLKARGVKFEFFRRVSALHLDPSATLIDSVEFEQQALISTFSGDYSPIASSRGLRHWPMNPDWSQLLDGNELQRANEDFESYWSSEGTTDSIERGEHFHDVVLAIPIGAHAEICAELVKHSANWRQMVLRISTRSTLNLQMWTAESSLSMGWNRPDTIVTAYETELSTWADLSHLTVYENHGQEVEHIGYFVGPYSDPHTGFPPRKDSGFPARELARAHDSAKKWCQKNLAYLWPAAFDPSEPFGLKPGALHSVYCRSNYNPWDRYVLSPPDTLQYRMKADESGFENLFLAGDWVHTGLNAGAVESAVMAGFQAARGISGLPKKVPGETDFD